MLDKLITAAYEGQVFGPGEAFGVSASRALPVVKKQITQVADICKAELGLCVRLAWPNSSDREVARILQEISPKAVGFCPALAVGELPGIENTHRLAAAASAIGVMYFADQSVDRGDESMVEAIDLLNGNELDGRADLVAARQKLRALQHIESNIEKLALPEDAPIVVACYNDQVLANEVFLHKKSMEYAVLPIQEQGAFLDRYARELADRMVVDAGFPSVTSVLYAVYRRNDQALAPLAEVHSDPEILRLLRICNMVVRIADELGDWRIDAGQHPEWGVFSINPFNQYHPVIVERLCELGQLGVEECIVMQDAFKNFHLDEATREKNTAIVTELLFTHVRSEFDGLSEDFVNQYATYIKLCKRVLEIGKVNMMGDKALAGL